MNNKTNIEEDIIKRLKSLIKALKQNFLESFRLSKDSREILASDIENTLQYIERLEKENENLNFIVKSGMTEEEKKAIENFNNFVKNKDKEQETLYENEEFYRDDIEQNELFLKMLHLISALIQKQQAENERKDKIIDLMAKDKYENISMLEMAKIGQSIYYDPYKFFNGLTEEEAIKCIKQYFEKQVESEK